MLVIDSNGSLCVLVESHLVLYDNGDGSYVNDGVVRLATQEEVIRTENYPRCPAAVTARATTMEKKS